MLIPVISCYSLIFTQICIFPKMCSKLFVGDGNGKWESSEWPTEVDFLSMWPTQTWMERRQPPQSTAQSRPSAEYSQKTLQKCWNMKPQWICFFVFNFRWMVYFMFTDQHRSTNGFFAQPAGWDVLFCPMEGPPVHPGLPRLALWEFAPWLRPVDFEWPSEVVEVGITWPLGIIPNLWPL